MTHIVDTYITFGVQYGTDPDTRMIHPLGMTGDGYAAIEAPNRDIGRKIAHAIFGAQWAFDYSTPPKVEYAPLGEVLRIKWVDSATGTPPDLPADLNNPIAVLHEVAQLFGVTARQSPTATP